MVWLLVCSFWGGIAQADEFVDDAASPAVVDVDALEQVDDESVGPAAGDPDWMRRTERSDGGNAPHYRQSALRSMGVMLLLVGVMLVVHHWLRRKMAGAAPLMRANQLKVVSRLRVGTRQEVVVVDWEGDQVLLGVGPNFIHPLHRRINEFGAMKLDESALEEAGYGA